MKAKAILEQYQNHPDFLGIELTHVNQKGAVDDTPLHIASRCGSEQDVLDLLDLGADIHSVGDLGYTSLHFATLANRSPIVALLLRKGANPSIPNEFGDTAKDTAERHGYTDIARMLKRV
ncbi:ankyrin repeat domain-containing protein [Leeia sp.]|uniref:ankyrin repeat domain-containing protein n=1 Tax=Leeia sp. TaxID=2884678 RepID=UPI0035AEFB70